MAATDGGKALRSRASALPPDERRSMIIQATLPLVLEHAEQVTTRQIAEVAGIAEGTIFRVFDDKDAVIAAVVEQALDPAPMEEVLAALDVEQPLGVVIAEAIAVIQHRALGIWRLLSGLSKKFHQPAPPQPSPALTALFEAHRSEITMAPAEAAQRLRAITLATTHPTLSDDPMSPDAIAHLFLFGISRAASC
jgi:AcrR family transcriptional regulator